MTPSNFPRTNEERISADWVDYNGHMNVAYYVLVFDHATDGFLDMIDMTEKRRIETGSSVFVAEAHVTYEQEVMQDDEVYIESRVIDSDPKRLHLFHYMYRTQDNTLAATNELMILHVNLNDRRVGPFPTSVQEALRKTATEHAKHPMPTQAGQVIGIRHATKAS